MENRVGEGAAAFAGVAFDAADEADVGFGINKDFDVHQFAQFGFGEDEDAFDEDDGGGGDGGGFGAAGVVGEGIDGELDGAAGAKFADVGGEEVAFEGVGVVVVLLGALGEGQVGHVAVVGVVGEIGDVAGADLIEDGTGDGGFAGGGSAGDAEDNGGWGHGLVACFHVGSGTCVHVLSDGSKEAVAAVAQAGEDVAVFVEAFVEHGGIDLDVGMGGLEGGEPFRRGEDGDDGDAAQPTLFEE